MQVYSATKWCCRKEKQAYCLHIAEVARALMQEKNMPHFYWAKAVNTAVYIMNRAPIALVHDVTLEDKFTGNKPDLSHMKVFVDALLMCMYQMN